MIPSWISTIILVYMVIDCSIGMYFKHKYQGPYSDGKVHMYSPMPFTTIPYVLFCKITGRDYITKDPEGVHKISWKEYKEIGKECDDTPR